MKRLTVEEIKQFKKGEWFYIIHLKSNSQYYGKIETITNDAVVLDSAELCSVNAFSNYNITWVAYKNKELADTDVEFMKRQEQKRKKDEEERKLLNKKINELARLIGPCYFNNCEECQMIGYKNCSSRALAIKLIKAGYGKGDK